MADTQKDIVFDFKWNQKQIDALTTPATELFYGGAKGERSTRPLVG